MQGKIIYQTTATNKVKIRRQVKADKSITRNDPNKDSTKINEIKIDAKR